MLRTIFTTLFCLLATPVLAHSVDTSANHDLTPAAITKLGGPFTLTDQNGKQFTEKDLKGHPTALFFGFTSCPDICPTTLYDLTQLKKSLGPKGADLKVIMVTIDPKTDTPAVLKSYLSSFDSSFVGLSGTQKQIDNIANLWRITHRSDAGVITHTALVYLLDKNGELKSVITYQEDSAKALKKINGLYD